MSESHGGEVKNSARYESAIRRWFKVCRTEPDGLIVGSLMFWLTALPVATIGPAWLALAFYMDNRERGERTSYMRSLAFAFKTCRAKGWLLGLSDALALAMAGGCFFAIQTPEIAMALRAVYAVLFVLDVVYLASGMYRYPALVAEPSAALTMLSVRGFLMTLGAPGWTILFCCAELLALIICLASGVGFILLYPAVSALAGVCAYHEMASAYFSDPAVERMQEDEGE